MNDQNLVVVGVIVLAALVLLTIALVLRQRRRSAVLREEFGPEYDHRLREDGKRSAAEKELLARKEEHDKLELRPLTATAHQRYVETWSSIQTRFVDSPALVLSEADALVTQLLQDRGYPVDDFETKSRLLSVQHSQSLSSYRSAHAVEMASRSETADTESVRNAFLDFRRVFEDVLPDGDGETYPGETGQQPAEQMLDQQAEQPTGTRKTRTVR